MTTQLNPEKLRIITASAAAAAAMPPPEILPDKSVKNSVPALIACSEIGHFLLVESKRFEIELAALAMGDRQSRRNVTEVTSHMVYIAPQASKEAAEKKAIELRQLGISNFFIIQDNTSMKWGISLGIFKTEEAAHNHQANLVKQGVRSARIGARRAMTNKIAFQLRNIDVETKAALDKIKLHFPNQEFRSCE